VPKQDQKRLPSDVLAKVPKFADKNLRTTTIQRSENKTNRLSCRAALKRLALRFQQSPRLRPIRAVIYHAVNGDDAGRYNGFSFDRADIGRHHQGAVVCEQARQQRKPEAFDMRDSISRRGLMVAPMLAVPALVPSWAETADTAARLADLEARNGGRLGVALLDVATGRQIGNRADERFPMCSTFKALAAAFVLARVDRGEEQPDRRIIFAERDLVPPFTATKPHVGPGGMTIAELCAAAVSVSDSTAANLLLASFGGPTSLTAYLRSLGDPVTRLDRVEPDLNIVAFGDPRDTTSPAAMVETLRRLILGDALSEASRAQLTTWMIDAKDAATRRLRVGLPPGWRIANKPGTWKGVATNDIGVIWPPDHGPIVVAAYLAGSPAPAEAQEAILADVARIAAAGILS
jgi:beta-lactamase class A